MTYSIFPGRRKWSTFVLGALVLAALSGCAGQTVIESPTQSGQYRVAIQTDPITLNPPQIVTLSFHVTDSTKNKPVTAFENVWGAIMHTILVSSDLKTFHHSFTNSLVKDQASFYTYFPGAGTYHIYTLFKPTGDEQQLFKASITTGTPGEPATLQEDPSTIKTVGWLTFQLVNEDTPIKAGQATQLVFHVSERGNPVSGLWPYLDAPGHLWVVSQDLDSFDHFAGASEAYVMAPPATTTPESTPVATVPGTAISFNLTPSPMPTFVPSVRNALATIAATTPQQLSSVQQTPQSAILSTPEIMPSVAFGPDIAFTAQFPKAGLYKCWLEVQYRGQVITVDYVVKVQE